MTLSVHPSFYFQIQKISSNLCASVLGVLSGDCSGFMYSSPLQLGFKVLTTFHTFNESEAECSKSGATLVKWTQEFREFFNDNIKQ